MNPLKVLALAGVLALAACEKEKPEPGPKKVWMVYEAACDSCKVTFLNPDQKNYTRYEYLDSGLILQRDTFEFTEGDSMYLGISTNSRSNKDLMKTNIYYVGETKPVIPYVIALPTKHGAQIKYFIPKSN